MTRLTDAWNSYEKYYYSMPIPEKTNKNLHLHSPTFSCRRCGVDVPYDKLIYEMEKHSHILNPTDFMFCQKCKEDPEKEGKKKPRLRRIRMEE